MEDILSYILSIGVVVLFTLIGGKKKSLRNQKSEHPLTQKTVESEDSGRNFENYFQESLENPVKQETQPDVKEEDMLEHDFLLNEEYEPLEQVEDTLEIENVDYENIEESEMTTNILLKEVEMSNHFRKKDKKKINLRQAIIYQTILERPYN